MEKCLNDLKTILEMVGSSDAEIRYLESVLKNLKKEKRFSYGCTPAQKIDYDSDYAKSEPGAEPKINDESEVKTPIRKTFNDTLEEPDAHMSEFWNLFHAYFFKNRRQLAELLVRIKYPEEIIKGLDELKHMVRMTHPEPVKEYDFSGCKEMPKTLGLDDLKEKLPEKESYWYLPLSSEDYKNCYNEFISTFGPITDENLDQAVGEYSDYLKDATIDAYVESTICNGKVKIEYDDILDEVAEALSERDDIKGFWIKNNEIVIYK